VWYVLRRAGFTPQQPVTLAAERDEQAIEHWRRYQWPAVKTRAQAGRVDLLRRRKTIQTPIRKDQ
jgi:hypothetical protein